MINFLKTHNKILALVTVFLVVETAGIVVFCNEPELFAGAKQIKTPVLPDKKIIPQKTVQPTATTVTPAETQKDTPTLPIKPNTPKVIKANPISGTTTKNKDGGKTVLVAEGTVSQAEIQQIAEAGPSGDTPYTVKYVDETGQNAALEKPLKDYLNNQLKWSSEISSLYGIKVLDAGDVGWDGQYAGSYSTNSKGELTSSFGWINLNSFYAKSYAQGDTTKYVKYVEKVLSHEYGHHYTLYYKWHQWKLLAGTRFPDDYYTIRPLAKAATSFDYSLGATDFEKWEDCDAEIIAEDYSYIYSGFGQQAMSEKFGYPAMPAVRDWLSSGLKTGPAQSPVIDNPPTVSITSPASGEVSGVIDITAEAHDDTAVAKVAFYRENDLIAEDTAAPYEAPLDTRPYANGTYNIKALAYDNSGHVTAASMPVTFNNKKPVVTINFPASDPYDFTSGNLRIEASATADNAIAKMEIYINDYLAASGDGSQIVRFWPYTNGEAGSYILKVKAYDETGNVGEKAITINKK